MIMEQTKSLRDKAIELRRLVTETIERDVRVYNLIEVEHDKFFSQITKLSSDFKLVKTPRVLMKEVYFRHSNNKTTVIDKVYGDWNHCQIVFTGKFPEKERYNLEIEVCEHKTSSKSGYQVKNHGFKIKLRLNYDKPVFYKSGKGVVNKVKDHVNYLWECHNRKIEHKQKEEIALSVAKKNFKDASKVVLTNGFITIAYPNGSLVYLYYASNIETKTCEFKFKNFTPPTGVTQKNLNSFMKSISKL